MTTSRGTVNPLPIVISKGVKSTFPFLTSLDWAILQRLLTSNTYAVDVWSLFHPVLTSSLILSMGVIPSLRLISFALVSLDLSVCRRAVMSVSTWKPKNYENNDNIFYPKHSWVIVAQRLEHWTHDRKVVSSNPIAAVASTLIRPKSNIASF